MAATETSRTAPQFQILSEAHGPHWVAWLAGPDGKPHESVLLVGQTREEAEARARKWAESRASLTTR